MRSENSRNEALAAQRALQLQEQRLRSAIDEKVSEVRTQTLALLRQHLERVLSSGWNAGAMPAGMQRQLESLAASAQVLTQSDQSLAVVVERIDRIRETGADRSADEGALQDEVAALLNQLNQQLTGNAVVPSEIESLDRAYFVEF